MLLSGCEQIVSDHHLYTYFFTYINIDIPYKKYLICDVKTSIIKIICIQDRNERYIPQLYEILEKCVSADKDSAGNIVLTRPGADYVLVNQDEKIHHSNDVEKW